jgi:serine protease AprX
VIVTTTPASPVDENQGQLDDGKGHKLGKVTKSFTVIHGEAVEVTGSQLLALVAQPGVVSVSPDAPVVQDAFAGPPALRQPSVSLPALAPSASAPAIAIVDSGVGGSTAFRGTVKSFDLTQGGIPTGASDPYGHGTLVAGIAAGAGHTYSGAAPGARIVSLDVVGSDGSARTSDVIAAADWIYANRAAYGIRVANFSLHSSAPSSAIVDPLDLAVRRLWLTGTVVVAAAGNEGSQRMLYAPASDPFVITVGAVGTGSTPSPDDDTAAPWSSYGYTADGFAKPELVAPGRQIVGPAPAGSALARTFPDRVITPGWMWMSGTSFAAPVVSGIAARLLALHPSWSPDQVKGALMATATPLSGGAQVGVGEVNAGAAASLPYGPSANQSLAAFVVPDVNGGPRFDGSAWQAAVANASWSSASWVSASWVSASWASASWVSSAYSDASWVSASWVSASWASASWVSGGNAP